jgi:hypothetical protein
MLALTSTLTVSDSELSGQDGSPMDPMRSSPANTTMPTLSSLVHARACHISNSAQRDPPTTARGWGCMGKGKSQGSTTMNDLKLNTKRREEHGSNTRHPRHIAFQEEPEVAVSVVCKDKVCLHGQKETLLVQVACMDERSVNPTVGPGAFIGQVDMATGACARVSVPLREQ